MKKRSFTEYTEEHLKRYDGWRKIIEECFDKIEKYLKDNDYEKKHGYNFNIGYIKEKYGRFDMTYSGYNDHIFDLCMELERKSENTCVICGCPGEIRYDMYWYTCLCDKHNKERLNEIEKKL